MHRMDFELTSDLKQDQLRERLNLGFEDVKWNGRDSEYLGVYTIARFENGAVVKIFQPGAGDVFEVEMAASKDVSSDWLEQTKIGILNAFSEDVH